MNRVDMPVLKVEGLSGGYGSGLILQGLDFTVDPEETIAVAGPNGCGKSTLVRGICHLLPEQEGSVKVLGREFMALGRKEFARLVAVVPQQYVFQFHFSVEELVLMGRIPHVSRFRGYTRRDRETVNWALEQVGLFSLRTRRIDTLSGGEKQSVTIAQALAQEPRLLILDEPTAYLDLSHQVEIMELLQRLREEHGMTVFLTSHDLNLAAMFCSRMLVMKGGHLVSEGAPREILTERLLREVYDIESIVVQHPDESVPHIMLRKKRFRDSGMNGAR